MLSETTRKDDSKLNLVNYWDFSQIRPKGKKAGRYSGGITLLVKTYLRKGVKIIDNSEGLLWFKLSKDFFNLRDDLYICAAYIPPQNSKNMLAKTDYFNNLLTTTSKF